VSVVSPLGCGIRSLTLFGKPLMADDTEIMVFRSSIPWPRDWAHESGDGNRGPDDSHSTTRARKPLTVAIIGW